MKHEDPFALFGEWFEHAKQHEASEPESVALATVSADGQPSIRMVLLRGLTDRGFIFYTNLTSRKGQHLAANPKAALCFHWKSTDRQIRIEGSVNQVSDAEADAYFASRPRESQIGAWASKQSQPLEGRLKLEGRVAKYAAKFHIGAVPRPDFWSGYLLQPTELEFWEKRPFRLHERTRFSRTNNGWDIDKLYP